MVVSHPCAHENNMANEVHIVWKLEEVLQAIKCKMDAWELSNTI